MQKILGLLVVLGCVFGGYFEAGGQLVAIWQPAEMIIILGAGFGAMIIGNPKHVLKEIAHQIKGVISKKQLGPEFQRQLLMCLYELLEMVQNGGLRMLDQHIEQPEESTIFQKYPLVLTQKRLVTFIADNFRLMAMGKIDAHELEGILDQELDTAEESLLTPSRSLQRTAEAMPGFGICAAVLGIIITMQSIDGSIALIGPESGGSAGGDIFRRLYLLLPDGPTRQRHGTTGAGRTFFAGMRAYRAGGAGRRQTDAAGGGRRA